MSKLERVISHGDFGSVGSRRADLLEAILKAAAKEYKEVQDDIGTSTKHIQEMLKKIVG